MNPNSIETNESSATKEQQERDHLDGLERERHGLPYSKEEHLRDLHFIEELHQHEQRAMREYTDYTFTILTFQQELDLKKQQEWNGSLKHVHSHSACLTVVWGRDSTFSRRVLVLFGWVDGTSQQEKEDAVVWGALEPLLKVSPHSRQIALCTPGLFEDVGPGLRELIIIQGSSETLNPPDPLLLFGLEELAIRTIPLISHDSPVELSSYTQGVTPELNGQRIIAILFGWEDEYKRSRFIDPEQTSYGANGSDEYERQVGSKMRDLAAQGATIESYLCHLKTWRSFSEPKKRRRRCVLM